MVTSLKKNATLIPELTTQLVGYYTYAYLTQIVAAGKTKRQKMRRKIRIGLGSCQERIRTYCVP